MNGTWQPGKASECEACAEKRRPRPVKRSMES